MIVRKIKDLYIRSKLLPSYIIDIITGGSVVAKSIFFKIISSSMNREMATVMAGRAEFYRSQIDVGNYSFQLRRNIHRLEKAMVMRPLRPIFATEYIGETVRLYLLATRQDDYDKKEIQWAESVLKYYFDMVGENDEIALARNKFLKSLNVPRDKIFAEVSIESENRNFCPILFEDLKSLITRRKSIRWYRDKKIDLDTLKKCLSVAVEAPSACNRLPYRFIATVNRDKAQEIASCAMGTSGWLDNIPAVIVVVGDLSAYSEPRDRHGIYIDSSLAVMQLLLALEIEGVSSCIVNWPEIEEREVRISKMLDLKAFERVICLVTIGYPLEEGGTPSSVKRDLMHTLEIVGD